MEKKVEVLNSDSCQTTFSVELPEKEVKQVTEETYQNLQSRASIAGFRRGKVPLEMVKEKFVAQAREEVVEKLISGAVGEILEEKNFKPVVPPQVEKLNFDFEKSFTFHLVVEYRPVFEPQGYQKMRLEKKLKKIEEKDVEKAILSLQERNAYLVESKEDTVKKEHFLLVDYEISSSEKSSPVDSLKNQLVDLSQPDLIPGLREQLLGVKKNETKEVKVTFPLDYPRQDLAGKESVLKVKVQALKERCLPEIDDKFAHDLSFTSLEELKSKVKESLEKIEERRTQMEIEKQITEQLLKSNPIPLPPGLVERELLLMLEEAQRFYQAQNLSGEWEKGRVQLEERYRPEAEKRVRLGLILSSIAEKEKFDQKEEKIFDFLIKNAKIKEINAKTPNSAKTQNIHKDAGGFI